MTIFIHCRTDFNWVKMLRYYWVNATETIDVKMSSTTLPYFYEYLGAGGVLVIKHLNYITLVVSLHGMTLDTERKIHIGTV